MLDDAEAVGPLDFDALYTEQFDFVWRNLRRLGVPAPRLRDAAQDVFVVVHRRLASYEGRGSIQSWLYSIARRVAADHRRHRQRKDLGAYAGVEDEPDRREPGPELRAVQGEAMTLLLSLLDQLEPDRRELLVLVDLEELSVADAAAALGVNVNTAYSRLRSARETMRAGLARHRDRSQPT